MNEHNYSSESFEAALHEVMAKWMSEAQAAEAQGQRLSVANMQQAFYQRGLAEGLRAALKDLYQLLGEGEEAEEQSVEHTYAYVTREDALDLLGRAGLHVRELHQHEDHTFSAILLPLQVFTFEERLETLRDSADIVILAKGKLPNSNKSYVDFAFTTPYSP